MSLARVEAFDRLAVLEEGGAFAYHGLAAGQPGLDEDIAPAVPIGNHLARVYS
jgi:hypothetical protein